MPSAAKHSVQYTERQGVPSEGEPGRVRIRRRRAATLRCVNGRPGSGACCSGATSTSLCARCGGPRGPGRHPWPGECRCSHARCVECLAGFLFCLHAPASFAYTLTLLLLLPRAAAANGPRRRTLVLRRRRGRRAAAAGTGTAAGLCWPPLAPSRVRHGCGDAIDHVIVHNWAAICSSSPTPTLDKKAEHGSAARLRSRRSGEGAATSMAGPAQADASDGARCAALRRGLPFRDT